MTDDMDAKMHDLPRGDDDDDDGSDDDDDGDDEQELDKQMGDLGDEQTDKLDEQVWGSDGEDDDVRALWLDPESVISLNRMRFCMNIDDVKQSPKTWCSSDRTKVKRKRRRDLEPDRPEPQSSPPRMTSSRRNRRTKRTKRRRRRTPHWRTKSMIWTRIR